VQHFSFCDQLFHRTGYVSIWHVRIDPVLVIQIDAVGSEALQAGPSGSGDDFSARLFETAWDPYQGFARVCP
jgi:hypothetical protein